MENSLGNLISEHEENKTATGSTLLVGLVCFGMTAMMAVFFYGEKQWSFNKVLFGVGAIAAFGGGIGCVLSVLRNRGARVRLFENGLIIEKGGKSHLAAWNEIASVRESVEAIYFKGKYVYDRYNYTIEKTNGENFILSNMISDIDRIGKTIKEKTLENLYPQAIAKINGGGQVMFGSLAIDKNGVVGASWTELSSVKIEKGMIEIKDQSGKTIVSGSYGAIPNAHLLIALLKDRLSFEP